MERDRPGGWFPFTSTELQVALGVLAFVSTSLALFGVIRYQKAIRQSLAERVEREKLKPEPDTGLIRRIEFLKVGVVVGADKRGTSEYDREAETRSPSPVV